MNLKFVFALSLKLLVRPKLCYATKHPETHWSFSPIHEGALAKAAIAETALAETATQCNK